MKTLLKLGWLLVTLFITVIFVISCLTGFIPPSNFSWITLFAYLFPILFVVYIILLIINYFVNKRWALIMLCIALLSIVNVANSIAFHPFSGWRMQKNEDELRILTWNTENFVDIRKGSPEKDSMLSLIHQYNPDVLCLQEVVNDRNFPKRTCISDTLAMLGYPYFFFSGDEYYDRRNKNSAHGVFIFSKTPFLSSDTLNILNLEKHENLASAVISFQKKPLRINTAHLASFGLYTDTTDDDKSIYEITYERKRSVQYQLRGTELQHQQQVNKIRDFINNHNEAQVYCGDINTTPASYNYRQLKAGWQDAYLQKGFGIGNTFYQILPTLRIDIMLLSNDLQVQQCTVIRRKLSDHFSVVADVKWK